MKYLLLKHYGGGPKPTFECPPMDQWTPEEITNHIQFMRDFASRLEETGELVGALLGVHVDHHPAGDQLLGLRERAVDDGRLALAVEPDPGARGAGAPGHPRTRPSPRGGRRSRA